jgi:hypothetical protein
VRCIVIPADPTQPCRLEDPQTLRDMQALVGGYIEAVRVDRGRPQYPQLPPGVREEYQVTLYVNEEYRFIEGAQYNERASWFYPWAGGILGDAFICGSPTFDGDDTDVPNDLIKLLIP